MSYFSYVVRHGKCCVGLVTTSDNYYIYLSNGKDLLVRDSGCKDKADAEVALGLFLFEYRRMQEYRRALEGKGGRQKLLCEGQGSAMKNLLTDYEPQYTRLDL